MTHRAPFQLDPFSDSVVILAKGAWVSKKPNQVHTHFKYLPIFITPLMKLSELSLPEQELTFSLSNTNKQYFLL